MSDASFRMLNKYCVYYVIYNTFIYISIKYILFNYIFYSQERLYQAQTTNSDFFKPLDMNPLIKKAATNIDIDAMGSKGIFQ